MNWPLDVLGRGNLIRDWLRIGVCRGLWEYEGYVRPVREARIWKFGGSIQADSSFEGAVKFPCAKGSEQDSEMVMLAL